MAGQQIGYARVSTQGQDLDQQRSSLTQAGCQRIFEEKISGSKRDRPELGRVLDHLRAGDVLTVTRLDRLARSTTDLLHIAEQLKGVVRRNPRNFRQPSSSPATSASRPLATSA